MSLAEPPQVPESATLKQFRPLGELISEVSNGGLQQIRETYLGPRDDEGDLQLLAHSYFNPFKSEHVKLLTEKFPRNIGQSLVKLKLVEEYWNIAMAKTALEQKMEDILTREEMAAFSDLAGNLNLLNPEVIKHVDDLQILDLPDASPGLDFLDIDPLRDPENARQWIRDNNKFAGGLTGASLARAILFTDDAELRQEFLSQALGIDRSDSRIVRLGTEVLSQFADWMKTAQPFDTKKAEEYPRTKALNALKEILDDKLLPGNALRLAVDVDLARASQATLWHLSDKNSMTGEQRVGYAHSGPRSQEEFLGAGSIQAPAQLIEYLAEFTNTKVQPTLCMEGQARPRDSDEFGVQFIDDDRAKFLPSITLESPGADNIRARYESGDFSLFPSTDLREYAFKLQESVLAAESPGAKGGIQRQLEEIAARNDPELEKFLKSRKWSESDIIRSKEMYEAAKDRERSAQRAKCTDFASLVARHHFYRYPVNKVR